MKKLVKVALAVIMALCVVAPSQRVFAEENVYTVTVSGYYRSPADGEIEDSGGESQYALGQSMVESVVETTGVLEELSDGGYALYVRFDLMDNISDVSFKTMKADGDSWSSTSYEVTGSTSDTKDFYIPIPAKDSYVRAECYVEPMGRSVIFYIGFDNLTAGNSTTIALYEGKTGSDTDSSSDSTDSDESVSVSTSDGLTIGYADSSSQSDSDTDSSDTAVTDFSVIDDSVWIILFAVVFSAVFLAGLFLILVVLLVKRIQCNHEEIRVKNIKKLDRYEREYAFEDEF